MGALGLAFETWDSTNLNWPPSSSTKRCSLYKLCLYGREHGNSSPRRGESTIAQRGASPERSRRGRRNAGKSNPLNARPRRVATKTIPDTPSARTGNSQHPVSFRFPTFTPPATFLLPAVALRCSIRVAYQAADAGHPYLGRASSPLKTSNFAGQFIPIHLTGYGRDSR
jgi:hypothetical protein